MYPEFTDVFVTVICVPGGYDEPEALHAPPEYVHDTVPPGPTDQLNVGQAVVLQAVLPH